MMHMSYWFGTDLGSFLFQGYIVTTTWGLIVTCLGLGSLAIVFEGMKIIQIKLRLMTLAALPPEHPASNESATLLSRLSRPLENSTSSYCGSWAKWSLEVIHWSIHTTLGYVLMLAVMSYNGYLSIALALGAGLGYWIFGPKLQQLNMLQFHKNHKNVQCDRECADAIINTERRRSTVSVIAEQLVAEVHVEVHT